MATKKDKRGTIHEIEAELADIEQKGTIRVENTKQINYYIEMFNELKLFPKNADSKKKKEIISNLKVENINELEISIELSVLDSTIKYNKLIEKERKKIQNQIKAGKKVRLNKRILDEKEKIEIDIPRDIRNNLQIYNKAVLLRKKSDFQPKNRIKYYSGQDYNFVVRTGFARQIIISENELQKIRKEGNVTEYLIKRFETDVTNAYNSDKKKFAVKDPKKWKAKEKVFKKLFKVIQHNLQIATNKKYNKKLVSRDEDGNISKDDSEYPILMKILDELIDLYIP